MEIIHVYSKNKSGSSSCVFSSLHIHGFLMYGLISFLGSFFGGRFSFCFNFSLFLTALGLGCCVQAFSSCGEQGLLFVAGLRLLIVVASPVAERGL